MKSKTIMYRLLPILGVIIDYTLGYPALSWVTVSLSSTIIPETVIVLMASVAIVFIELLFGASNDKLLKVVGFFVICIVPAFTIAEGFNLYTESVFLEMPGSDVIKIIIIQSALVVLSFSVHLLVLKNATNILALYSGMKLEEDEINEYDNYLESELNDVDTEQSVKHF